MTLADTSAWIDFIRDSRAAVADAVEELIRRGQLVTTEPVIMEVLAGARDLDQELRLGSLLAGARLLPVPRLTTWESAAVLYRQCRAQGFTPRSQIDCLIAAVAIREDLPLLHADRDFDEIAKHAPLQIAPV